MSSPAPPAILSPTGRRAAALCPACGADRAQAINTAGFGVPIICCRQCGHYYEGATE